MTRLTHISAVLFLAMGVALSSAHAATIYVDAGNPSPPGDGSVGDPFVTIAEGVTELATQNGISQGGHTLSIAAATYTEAVTFSGSHAGGAVPNTMLATGGDVIIDSNGLVLNLCTNMIISGITVDQASGEGIKLLTGVSDGVVFTNCTVRRSARRGIYLSRYNSNVTIQDSYIYDNGYSGIYLERDNSGIVMNHCLILANGDSGIYQNFQCYITLRNSIIAGNGGFGAGEEHNQGDITPIHCCFYGNGRGDFRSYEYPGYLVEGVYNTGAGIDSISGGYGNIVANPGFSDLVNNWNFSEFYSDSATFGTAEGGDDIGPHQSISTVTPANNTYYVNDATGNDANSIAQAQNPLTPWKSVVHAATIAAAGDTVNVATGTYTGQVTITKGGSINPVTYIADGTVILDGQSANATGLYLDFASGIVLDGFEVKSYTSDGVALNYSMSNSLYNLTTHQNGRSGIYFKRSQRTALLDTTICSNTTYGIFMESEAYYRSGSGGTTLDRCRIFGHSGWVDYAIYKATGLPPERISNCDIYNNFRGIFSNNGIDFTIENSVLRGHDLNAVSYAVSIALSAIKCTVRNCIIADNVVGLNEGHVQGDFHSINNCFYNNSVADYYDADGGGNLTNVVDINNLADVTSTNNIDVDPLFVDPATGNFQLSTGSLCINAGTTNTDFILDLYGNPRFSGIAVDIGSFEYDSSPPAGTFIVIN